MLIDQVFVFPGKYADMVKYLTKNPGQERLNKNIDNSMVLNLSESAGLFNRNLDVFFVSAAIGISKDILATDIPKTTDITAKIAPEQLLHSANKINYLYAIAMLSYTGENNELTLKQRIERAFRVPNEKADTPEKETIQNECTTIFKRYVFGGLEYLYDYFSKFIDKTSVTYDSFDQEIIEMIMNLIPYVDSEEIVPLLKEREIY